ncbi:hypothetical protein PHMEG_0009359 [Phytophthora megakarya]|uniref:Uncharacterized protein n=1 Tax=Phytophthora megakarya TaxID=4795 RepID=A0A225WGE4_9STRA|nr:hypothetical protein PHMEG_0009359 [Phytophthora megakarya]
MAPKVSSAFAFHEQEQLHKNSSILAYTGDVGQNYLDLGDQENEQNSAIPRRHSMSTERKKTSNNSRLTSLSSSLNSARSAVASHAKKLHVRESTRHAISQLRKSIVKASSRPECKESSTQTQSNQFDNDHYTGHHTELENGYECMYAEVSLGNSKGLTHSRESTTGIGRLLPTRPWVKTSKLTRRFGEELY